MRDCEGEWGRQMRERLPSHRFRFYISHRLHRRIFVWFGASILMTGLAFASVFALSSTETRAGWHQEVERVQRFVGHRFS